MSDPSRCPYYSWTAGHLGHVISKSVFYKKRNEKENPVWGHGKSGVVKTVKFFTET